MDKQKIIIAAVVIGLIILVFGGIALFKTLSTPRMTYEDVLNQDPLYEEVEPEPADPKELVMIKFESIELEAIIAEALGVTVPINQKQIEELKELKVWSSGIKKLKGLEYAINLEKLDLYNNEILDITPIATLTKLKSLNLSHNSIKNITVLSNLLELQEVNVASNDIQNVSPLGALNELIYIDASDNYIETCDNLSNLKKIQQIKIQNNRIMDFTSLKSLTTLKTLWVFDNKTKDTSQFEEGFPEIKDFVYK